MDQAQAWWRDSVIYQIYVRSFADSNGDGIGDLPGIIGKLDYLEWLGVDALWLSPIHPSPNADWGYDVSDYYSVHPDFGTVADLDQLIEAAGKRGIKVLLDLVPNHTSDQHSWFKGALRGPTSQHRDWYVWRDKPNNWRTYFGGSGWTLEPKSGQYYFHNFLPQQPDLNWWNNEVRREFEKILKYWFDRGVAGFRIDVANALIKDKDFKNNPPGRRNFVYNSNRPEVHGIYQEWRQLADFYQPSKLLLGETNVHDYDELAKYFGDDNELQLAFNFLFWGAKFSRQLPEVVRQTEAAFGPDHWPVWTASNHDHPGRFASRWAGNNPAKVKAVLMMLATLRGTPVLYYGDEIGLPNVHVGRSQMKDPLGRRYWPLPAGRDKARTPMHWNSQPNAGFTTTDAKAWLPVGKSKANVQDQKEQVGSVLNFTQALLHWRRGNRDLLDSPYQPIDTPPGIWAWRRGRYATVLNLTSRRQSLQLLGVVLFSTDQTQIGREVSEVSLPGWHGAIIQVL